MKLKNRLSGKTLDPSTEGLSALLGEFLLEYEKGVKLNGLSIDHATPIVPNQDGKIILQDAQQTITLEMESQLLFQDYGPSQAFRTIAEELSMVQSWEDLKGVLPLISEIEGRLELTDFEKHLQQWLFHLEAICHSPASKLTRLQEKTPVSRAKRIPTRAIDYLAGHSEDWLRRKFKSVEPRTILAEFIEETIDIYENQVTLRLMHRLLRYLRARIEDELQRIMSFMGRLEEMINRHGKVEGSYWYPKVHRNFELAGKAFTGNLENNQRVSQNTLAILTELRHRLFRLMNTSFASEVSPESHIEPELRMTNKFVDDQHYKIVAKLWAMLNQEQEEKTPEEIQGDRLQAMNDFTRFCGLLLCRALRLLHFTPRDSKLGIFEEQEKAQDFHHAKFPKVTLSMDKLEVWILWLDGTMPLRFVAMPEQIHTSQSWDDSAHHNEPGLHILYLFQPGSSKLEANQNLLRLSVGKPSTPTYVPVSPEDFDSVERVARAILWHLVEKAWSMYPVKLSTRHGSMLREVLKALDVQYPSPDGNQFAISESPVGIEAKLKNFIAGQKKALSSYGKQKESDMQTWDNVEEELTQAFRQVRDFPFCPLCGSSDSLGFQPWANGNFHFHCDACNVEIERRDGVPAIIHKHLPSLLQHTNDVDWDSKNDLLWLDGMFGMDILAIPKLRPNGGLGFNLE